MVACDFSARQRTLEGESVVLQGLVGVFLALRLDHQFQAICSATRPTTGSGVSAWTGPISTIRRSTPGFCASIATIFGWHSFSVRLLTWVTLAGVLAIFWAWAKRLAPAEPALWFWRSGGDLSRLAGVLRHDNERLQRPSVGRDDICSRSTASSIFAERAETGKPFATRWLYFAAIGLGLATLTKYNAVFVGLGFGLTFLLRPQLRSLLETRIRGSPALVAIGMQAPVLWWNFVQGGASFRFHFDERWGDADRTVCIGPTPSVRRA